ncbi:MAG: inorganic phosphate transporter [Spirochaetes bacterium]|nr:inorganic phosphate transporter [Spirochaetota bacterium]
MEVFIIILIAFALIFDFINGFHDSANSIATVVATRVLPPQLAVLWAGFFNFIALFIFGLHVAKTVGKGIVDVGIIDTNIIFATLVGAIIWNLITWFFGIPSSSSHALMGGLIGAALVKAGPSVLIWGGIIKTVVFIFVAPILGLVLGLGIGALVYRLANNFSLHQVDGVFRKGQLLSAAFYSIGHGGNDAQKTIGIIMGLLIGSGMMGANDTIPKWVIFSCYTAIGLGTMFGGWRIVKTMGHKVTKLRPVDGFCAELGASVTLFISTSFGIPVSTTHTITGSIMGIGMLKRLSAVKWTVAGQLLWAWVLTIPCAAGMSALAYIIVRMFHHVA